MKTDLYKTSGASPPRLSVSIATAAEMLEASEQTIMRLIKTKKLRAAKVNRRNFIKVSDLVKMLDTNPAVGGINAK
jgi:excisionase family DNA binding protein